MTTFTVKETLHKAWITSVLLHLKQLCSLMENLQIKENGPVKAPSFRVGELHATYCLSPLREGPYKNIFLTPGPLSYGFEYV